MARKKAPAREGAVASLYGDIAALTSASAPGGLMHPLIGAMREQRLLASLRSDMGGASTGLYAHPQTYQQKVAKIWEAYSQDSLFGRLTNRTVEFAANGGRFEVGARQDGESWTQKIKNWVSRRNDRIERQEEFWNHWASKINQGVPGVLPGILEVTRWGIKHLLLSGMFIPQWEIGELRFGKQTYRVPVQMTCHPASSITLYRQQSLLMREEIYLRVPPNWDRTKDATQQVQFPMIEGLPREAQSQIYGLGRGNNSYVNLPALGTTDGQQNEAFALKYNWSPGDLVATRTGQTSLVGQGVYPHPMFYALLPWVAQRMKLSAADLAILDGVINYLIIYSIGDKDFPPKPPQKDRTGAIVEDGTIAQVRKLIQDGRIGPAMELFLPHYVKVTMMLPDVKLLINDAKYRQPVFELFAGFGLFFSLNARGDRLDKVNTANFEEMVGNLRNYIKAFWEMMAADVVRLNPGKLTEVPSWVMNPLNTKTDAYFAAIQELAKTGKVSTQTQMRVLGIDPDVEYQRIASDMGTDVDEMTDQNVPLSYVQQTVQPGRRGADTGNPDGRRKPADGDTTTTTGIPPTKQRGRPKEPLAADAGPRKRGRPRTRT